MNFNKKLTRLRSTRDLRAEVLGVAAHLVGRPLDARITVVDPVISIATVREEQSTWFVELLGEPIAGQDKRKHWRRIHTDAGDFGLPSFRYMGVAVHGADETEFGLRVARPSRMALAHLLEHSEPDRTPISNLPGTPPRFTKDIGRAVALWWLAREQSPVAGDVWLEEWRQTLANLYPGCGEEMKGAARSGLDSVTSYMRDAHKLAIQGVLAPHSTTLDAIKRAQSTLHHLLEEL